MASRPTSMSMKEVKDSIDKAREVVQKTQNDINICFELQIKLAEKLKTKKSFDKEVHVIVPGATNDYEQVNLCPTDHALPNTVSLETSTEANSSTIPKETTEQVSVEHSQTFESLMSSDISPLKSPEVLQSSIEAKENAEVNRVNSSTQLLQEDQSTYFLLETDELPGRPRTKLKTLVDSTLKIKKLTPHEADIFKRDQDLTKSKAEVEKQRAEIEELKVKTKMKPSSTRGLLLKLPSFSNNVSAGARLKRFLNGTGQSASYGIAKKYFFILSGRFLLYYSSYPSSRPRRSIDLYGASVQALKSRFSPTGFEIRINTSVRTEYESYQKMYRLCPKDETEAVSWTKSLQMNIKWIQGEMDSMKKQKSEQNEEHRKEGEKEDGEEEEEESKERSESLLNLDISTQIRVPAKTFYDILNVPLSATEGVLKKRYRILAMQYHPDKAPDDVEKRAQMQKDFAEISRAYSVLKDNELRKMYDLTQNVKASLRLGVICNIYFVEEENLLEKVALFCDEGFEYLIWQDCSKGTVLSQGYHKLELRFVQRIFAGEDFDALEHMNLNLFRRRCSAVLTGKRKGCDDVVVELESPELRDELLDGLRSMRCEASMLFQQNLDKMKAQRFR